MADGQGLGALVMDAGAGAGGAESLESAPVDTTGGDARPEMAAVANDMIDAMESKDAMRLASILQDFMDLAKSE